MIADGLFCFPASLFVLSSLPLATSSSRNNINANGSPLKPCTDGSCDPDSEESPIGHERRSQPGTGQSQDAHRPACDTDALMQAEEVTETKAEANRAPALVNGDGEAPGISKGQQEQKPSAEEGRAPAAPAAANGSQEEQAACQQQACRERTEEAGTEMKVSRGRVRQLSRPGVVLKCGAEWCVVF